MFAQIKGVVDLIRSSVLDFQNFKTSKKREEAVLDLLSIYFLLKDCLDDGEKLVFEAQPNPIEKVAGMDAALALATIEGWDTTIQKQGLRLYKLQSALLGQDHIAVINPALQKRLNEAIGSKMDRAVTLHSIGSALFFKSIFPIAITNEEKIRYIFIMAGEKEESLNMLRIGTEIENLRESLNQYRSIVERMVSDTEILELSTRARQETQW